MPHDCRAGRCGSCAVTIIEGQVYGGECSEPGMVLACQCRVISDVVVAVEDVPEVITSTGLVTGISALAADVVEVRIEPSRVVEYLPGQYFRLRFRGFPERCYSPTLPLDRPGSGRSIHFQIRRLPDGRVSSALGREIRKDHRVKITGPFGSAFLRDNLANRLVLIATGTGFAPIWSIANAAISENPDREIVIVVGAHTIESLYMARALFRIAAYPNVKIIPVASVPQKISKVVRHGRPTDFLPKLSDEDIVYVCGAPLMVDAVKEIVKSAGAVCYADPFIPQGQGGDDLWTRALSWFTGDAPATAALPPPQQSTRPRQRPILVSVPGDAPEIPLRNGARRSSEQLPMASARTTPD
jgi:3-phenylpropionate/trans-cinnamate dioxygenase ferredoxin reductase subunit